MNQYCKQIHENYKKAIIAFSENYKKDDEILDQIDSFFRMSALYLWGKFNADVNECIRALPEIYSVHKPSYSSAEIENVLDIVKHKKITIKVPEFFDDIVEYDKEHVAYYSRVFINGLQYVLLMFALIDDVISMEEIQTVLKIVKLFSDFCDKKAVREYSIDEDLTCFASDNTNNNSQAISHDRSPDITEKSITIEDDSEDVIDKLNHLIGLDQVKNEINAIISFAKVQRMRKQMNLSITPMSYHLVFTGNPGTGKTTVARLISEIYRSLGILSKGHLVEVDRGSLVAGYVGQTAIKTKEMIEKAKGGVLFIDEAYSLVNGDDHGYGQEAIDTLLKAMEDYREDFVVIVAGYNVLMEDFINSNPGLQSRFTHYVHFDDYTGLELYRIFEQFCADNQYKLDESARQPLEKYFSRLAEKHGNNFGNAREVRNFFENVILNQANRVSKNVNASRDDIVTVLFEDLNIENSEESLSFDKAIEELNGLVGLDAVKKEIDGLVQLVKYQKIRKEKGLVVPNVSLHLVFTGNPGTGKTTVARCVAKIYKCLGLVSEGQFIETDRSGLVAGYVGQTALKTKKVIDRAIGGILFIDEAYTLLGSDNDFGQEAIDTLLKAMEDNRDNLVVIVAGYTNKMESFIHSNPGLESRFNRYIKFEDYTPSEMVQIFKGLCKKNQYTLSDESDVILRKYFTETDAVQMGNGRGVRNLFEKIISYQANHLNVVGIENEDALSVISADDIRAVIYQGGV